MNDLGIKKETIAVWPYLLCYSVEDNLKPTFEWLRNEAKIDVAILRNNPSILTASLQTMKSRISLLREAGVPSSDIKMSHLRNMSVEKARLAWQARGRHSMPTAEKLRIMMKA
eukprot:7391786-Prymnesium_polylepis.1